MEGTVTNSGGTQELDAAIQKTIDEKLALAKKVHKLTEDGKTPFTQLVKKYSEDKPQYDPGSNGGLAFL